MAVVQVIGLGDAKRAIAELAADAPAMALQAIKAGGALVGEAMKRRAPRLSDDLEGTLGRSIQTRPAGRLGILVGTSHGLAGVVEFGGEITPRRAEYLHFEGRSGEVFTRRVTMPARPFVRPAVDESRVAAVAQIKRSAQRRIKRVAGRG